MRDSLVYSKLRSMRIVVAEVDQEGRPAGGYMVNGQRLYWKRVGPYEALYRTAGALSPVHVLSPEADDWKEV